MGLVSFYALIQMELEQRLGRIEEAQEQIVAVRMCNGSSHSMEQYGANPRRIVTDQRELVGVYCKQ